MTNADIGHGTKLQKGNADGPPETFSDLTIEITSLQPPGFTRDAIDATNMGSADKFREYIEGLLDGGEVEIEGNFEAAASDVVSAEMTAATQSWRILFPNATHWTFEAFFTAYQPQVPVDDKMSFTATMKVTGKSTIGTG